MIQCALRQADSCAKCNKDELGSGWLRMRWHHGRFNRQAEVAQCISPPAEKDDTKFKASCKPDRQSARSTYYWEGDTVIGTARKQAIVTLVEHKSGFAVQAKLSNRSADLVGRAIEAKLKPLNLRVKTLTVDKGKEFSDHQAIEQTLGIQTYFADPYCSWQRGSKENFNGLLRHYIPKRRR